VERNWAADVERTTDLGVTHVSAYGLTAEARTPLGRWVDLGRIRMPGGTRYAEEYGQVASSLAAAGFEHYEVSNFAREGHASRHNWHYWDGSEYLGVGPSAHSHVGGERVWNVTRWDRYRSTAESGESLREGRERPDAEQRRLERIWLGLRTSRGLPREELDGVDQQADLAVWEEAGWLTSDAESLRLTTEGWLRLDLLSAEIASWKPRSSGGRTREMEAPYGRTR
jgi:oxygen-independent coproporphyrinogen-3 oxidase